MDDGLSSALVHKADADGLCGQMTCKAGEKTKRDGSHANTGFVLDLRY
jgi:hypothetical protein